MNEDNRSQLGHTQFPFVLFNHYFIQICLKEDQSQILLLEQFTALIWEQKVQTQNGLIKWTDGNHSIADNHKMPNKKCHVRNGKRVHICYIRRCEILTPVITCVTAFHECWYMTLIS